MNKREFIKSTVWAGAAAALASTKSFAAQPSQKSKIKHWIWINPDVNDTDAMLDKRYQSFYDAGIRGVFFGSDSEKHFRAARRNKLEAHRWMWTMNRGEKELLNAHPEWYAVSRNGDSCAEKPPYVDYYRWLCPNKEEVQRYLEDQVKEILRKDYVDGIHLDYIRYCDVILPVNLWEKYNLEQTTELPEYDFCYCDTCRSKFKEQKGMDPMEIRYPGESLSWRKFRYDSVNTLVNRLARMAASYNKPITAAVFPTPEVARRIVRQDWTEWSLNAVYPMIYHGFYKEDVAWIGDAVAEGIKGICGKFPLYAGLFLPDFKSGEELKKGIEYALKNGAGGVSLFGDVNEEVLGVLKAACL